MDSRAVRLLLEIAQRGSFAEVARDRDLDPSSVSRMVAAIEDELGFRMFQRTTRRVVPTEAGEIYLAQAAASVEALDHARDEALSVTRGPTGTLRITATIAYGQKILVPLVPRFRAAHPGVTVDLVLTDANVNLVAERIDLAVRLGPGVAGDFIVSKLKDTRYRVCVSPEYILRHGGPREPADLARHDCLRFPLPGFRSRWMFRDAAGEIETVDIGGGIVASSGLALHGLALAGAGPVLLASWLVDDDIAAGRLVDLFPDHAVTATTFEAAVWLIYPSRSFLPRKVRAMIDFLRGEAVPPQP